MAYQGTSARQLNRETDDRIRQQRVVKPARKSTYDYTLLASIVFLFAMGLLIIYSGSQYTAMLETGDGAFFFKRQLIIGGAGLFMGMVLSHIGYNWMKKGIIPWLAIASGVGLLCLTLILGLSSHGKTRWISIAGISFQPTEYAKICTIVFTAYLCDKFKAKINDPRVFWVVAAFGAIPAGLILSENLSSGFIVMAIVLVMLFVASRKWKIFTILGLTGLTGVLAAKPLLRIMFIKMNITQRPSQYWMRRIYAWIMPERFPTDAYQTQQGLYAIGSGGLMGRGLGESIQKFGKIPEIQNDMIFTVICEELGFFGAVTIIILYAFILYRIMKIAQNASNLFGAMLCVGIMAHIGIQVILNISVVTGIIPNTGVTLPFISYGGTAVLFTFIEMGIVLAVSKFSRK
ncbi:MAG: FtsW/RodA/SpoVE family cell cycle protein [Eubacteriales bacterium]|nr:FtsW/RodA/SpoVE family cell cycle protein [Eubacteriales bacterium]